MDKRKELKLAYKETPRPMGAYQIKNNVTGKIYVGGGMNLPGNFNSHRFQLNFKSHRNKALQEDWNLYGSDAFTFEVLESINADKISKDSWRKAVSELEEKWLNTLQPYDDRGYNPPPTPAKQALVAADTSL